MIQPKAAKTLTTVLGILLLAMMPATVVPYSYSIYPAFAQEDPFAAPFNNSTDTQNTMTQSQNGTGERLPSQQGFATRVLATNLSQPHNIIYGPDNVLWFTERTGMNITLVNPIDGTGINSIPIPGVHQSGGQDGLMGMTLDPDFINNHYIYVAYTYDANPGEELERLTKI
ncbi:MAG: PQQ-dependent sugar dehydrogenase, partial [Thermoproteota archaeon]|nr:PQQ-dependent sugar dehydrogenase [Thermoproteota archaeon]